MGSAARRPTQRDVARRAKVSQATVSQALADMADPAAVGRVAPETRDRVSQAMRELGYRPNVSAQRMRGGNSRILGVHTYGDLFPISAGNYNHEYLLGIQLAAEQARYDMLLFTSVIREGDETSAYLGDQNRLTACDGAVILGYREDHSELARFTEEGFPFVRIGRRELPYGRCGWVDTDFTQGTADLIDAVLKAGYNDLAYLAETHHHSESWVDRRAGLREAERRGVIAPGEVAQVRTVRNEINATWLEGQVTAGHWTFLVETHQLATRLVLAAQDLGAMNDVSVALLQAPVTDPVERSYVGYLMEPRLEVGRRAAELLLHMLDTGDIPEQRGHLVAPQVYIARPRWPSSQN